MNRPAKWFFLVNGFFMFTAYLWLFHQVDGARVFLVVMAWIMCLVSMFALSDRVIEARIKNGNTRPPAAMWLNTVYDGCFVYIFIFGGEPLAAVAYLISSFCVHAHYDILKKKTRG